MRTIALLLSCTAILYATACNNSSKSETNSGRDQWSYFGDTISAENATDVKQLAAELGSKDSLNIKVKGVIGSVCQKKGCWMKMDAGNNQELMVRFKDYGFFVPLDASGKEVIMEGYAFYDTTSVAQLQHYAEDAGKSAEEIAAITEPEVGLSYEAHGVIIKK